ncbi:HXXEE domain-containing protein [Streptococcus agalactiae]|nr:hypothetical protein GX026_05805 [Streptococcus agalactiae]AWQ29514.1 HXXEE domain-containing protein [Streptococcus agalactiae]OVF14404.1 HXXEE domain-containing protein [Streptococcus agalactiae]OVF14575.1 HXXEE domain-containing protein [Streptococcus agalactiae]OVF14747.1 HXXEE domain-containing protein [Streptococcus agalactiae]
MKALITKWYLFCPYLASLFALALFFGNWDLRVQSLLILGLFIQLHFFEEFGFPGGFPLIAMLVELKSVETDTSKWDLNHLSAFFGNQWFAVTVYLLPIFCPNIPFLTLAVMIFAFAELAMHLFFFNLSLKKWYNPGLLTTLVGLVPVSVCYLTHDWKLYSGLDWFLALIWIVLNYFIAFRSPIYKRLGRYSNYAFNDVDLSRSKPFLTHFRETQFK